MSNKQWVCAPLISLGLLGCATTLDPRVGGCSSGVCKVDVKVVDCIITLEPYELTVPLPRGPKKIHWDIVSADYIFAANGIVIKVPDGEFDTPDLSPNAKKFKWNNKHSKAGNYHYGVTVIKVGVDPKQCPTLDPLIANQ
jgi:hypothetical protein